MYEKNACVAVRKNVCGCWKDTREFRFAREND